MKPQKVRIRAEKSNSEPEAAFDLKRALRFAWVSGKQSDDNTQFGTFLSLLI